MKAIPFICSRTKNKDFISSYLVRPDFDWTKVRAIVSDTMYDLNTLDDLRFAVFYADNYCFVGIGCLSSFLVNKVRYDIEPEYLKDKVGRSLACFIGFAVPVSQNDCNVVPDIVSDDFLNLCCETYFKHLKRQWLNDESVQSEVISVDSDDVVDLAEKNITDISLFKPSDIEKTRKGISIIKNFEKEYLYYYLDQIINQKNYDENFINHIDFEDQWLRLQFKNASVSKNFLANLPAIEKREDEKKTGNIISAIKKLYNDFRIQGKTLEKYNSDIRIDLSNTEEIINNCLNSKSYSEACNYFSEYNNKVKYMSLPDIGKLESGYSDIIGDKSKIADEVCIDKIDGVCNELDKYIKNYHDNKKHVDEIKSRDTELEQIVDSLKKLDEYREEINVVNTANFEPEKTKSEYVKLREKVKSLPNLNGSINSCRDGLIEEINKMIEEINKKITVENNKQNSIHAEQGLQQSKAHTYNSRTATSKSSDYSRQYNQKNRIRQEDNTNAYIQDEEKGNFEKICGEIGKGIDNFIKIIRR